MANLATVVLALKVKKVCRLKVKKVVNDSLPCCAVCGQLRLIIQTTTVSTARLSIVTLTLELRLCHKQYLYNLFVTELSSCSHGCVYIT